jgi:NADH-quinone oxidoreductase subunit L
VAKSWPQKFSFTFRGIYTFLYQKWYFDELYEYLFVKPSLKLAKILWEEGDQEVIDGLGPNGLASLSVAWGGVLCRLQTGYVYHYAFAMIIGLVLMVAWYVWM